VGLGIPLSILIASAIIFPNLRQSLFSSDPQSYFAIWLKLPEGTTLEETNRQARILEEIIEKFRAEELEHRDTALEHDAEQALGYPVLSALVKAGSLAAIWLSTRI